MPRKKTTKTIVKKRYILAAMVVFLVILIILPKAINPVNTQCIELHDTSSTPPAILISANDYFLLGNYNYDKGDCAQAITDYTYAISLNQNFAEAYNNRAYTYMMQNDYVNAIPDLNKAIEIRPNYINALRNRGDIYNFYYQIDYQKALADYNKVIILGVDPKEMGICNHRLLAYEKGNRLAMIWDILRVGLHAGCQLPTTIK